MDFTVDKPTKTVTITADFDADRDLVWDAYTKAELLDQWWAPKPWLSRTKVMEFKEGGRRFYAMVSPDGSMEKWSVQKYTSITPKTNFKLFNAFSDENENLELPGSDWNLDFADNGGKTKVTISIYNESLDRMEDLIAMGFKEGITATLTYLQELLRTLSEQSSGAKA
ncbi:MAG: SRPBCC domain-containing protein [Acidobacteria bacterium]|nr:SRPBCC domain-containing protein [Acidobacteriota bacterium]